MGRGKDTVFVFQKQKKNLFHTELITQTMAGLSESLFGATLTNEY